MIGALSQSAGQSRVREHSGAARWPPATSPLREPTTIMPPKHRCALLLVVLAAGCFRWGPLPGAGLAHPESEVLGRVTVYLRDSTAVALDDAAITPDRIVGLEHGSSTRRAVVRSDAVRVETGQSRFLRILRLGRPRDLGRNTGAGEDDAKHLIRQTQR